MRTDLRSIAASIVLELSSPKCFVRVPTASPSMFITSTLVPVASCRIFAENTSASANSTESNPN